MLREAPNLTQLVVAPLGSLPALAVLDLTACPRLAHVFIQSPLLHTLLLDRCCALSKAWHALEHLPFTWDIPRGSAKPAAHVVPCQCVCLARPHIVHMCPAVTLLFGAQQGQCLSRPSSLHKLLLC